MSQHSDRKSPPAQTYTARPPLHGHTLTCRRCGRVYHYPEAGSPTIRCECGWHYENKNGVIVEEFKSRIGV